MARKRRLFFGNFQSFLRRKRQRSKLTLILGAGLLVFLITAQTPVRARVVINSPQVSAPAPRVNAQTLVTEGRELYAAGQFAQAAAVWQQASQAYRAQNNATEAAMVLSNLSLAYQQLGQWQPAQNAIAETFKILQASKSSPSQVLAQALNTQGSLQFALGQAQQALDTWQKAEKTYKQAGDALGVSRSLINQAQALEALGLYRRAWTTLKQVTETLQAQPNSTVKAAGLRSLGNTLRVVGDAEKSQQVLQQSLAVAQQIQSASDIAAALLSLGNTAQSAQNQQKALSYYQQAASAADSPINRIQAQVNQLNLLVDTQQLSTAQALLPEIEPQFTNLPTNRTAVYARIAYAQSLSRLKTASTQQTKALDNAPSWLEIAKLLAVAVKDAKDIGDPRATSYALGNLGGVYEKTQQISDAQDLTEQALLIAQAINAPDIAYRWQWQLGRLLRTQDNTTDAIAAYDEAVKSLQVLRHDLIAINPDVQFSFREEVEPVYRQLIDLLLATPQPSQQNLQKALQTVESLQLAELNNFFRAACLDSKRAINQVVDTEDRTAAIVYPIILSDRVEVILKLPQQTLRHYAIKVPQTQVASTLEDLRLQLIEPDTVEEAKSLSQKVYDWLIRPAEPVLAASSVKTLVFVLDGSLRNIPMAALYDAQRQEYLIQKYSVALAPSLQLIDPKPLKRQELKALTAGLSEPRYGFEGLNFVKSEIEQIQSEISSRVLLNKDFTTQALQNQINSVSFPVVHLATHGQFSSNADQTFILAWDKPIKVDDLNYLLRSSAQNKRPQPIELLVLSACETAAGDERAALGIAGVAIQAGARSTVASLWYLDDESTADLMTRFYGELAKTKGTKAEVLRQAQLALLKNPNYAHPMYWAPYVLVGNWL